MRHLKLQKWQGNDATANAGAWYRAIATGEASTLCSSCIINAEYWISCDAVVSLRETADLD
jgi:hypothetical protein